MEVIDGFQGRLEMYDGHEYIVDTIDGGLAFTIPDMPMYTEGPENPVTDMKDRVAQWRVSAPSTADKDRVDAKCQCGQVEFSILRPEEG